MANNNADRIKCSNVINLKSLRKYLKEFNNDVLLSKEEIDEIYNILLKANSHATNEKTCANYLY